MKSNGIRNLFFVFFAVSGFSGLIYESIWSHYLKLFLGHAAYAQSLVLAIFMGAMAVGSWITSKYSNRWQNLLLGYAIVEGLIGLLGLVFHDAFVYITEAAHRQILPALGSIGLVHAFKWAVAASLILPQSILLGMTFPLMSAGVIRWFPSRPGASLAILYFTNSLGAAIGVLASGFVLIGLVGLPGTILTASLLNIVLALVVWLLVRDRPIAASAPRAAARESSLMHGWYPVLLGVSLLTGTASFMYEIGWIRMLSLVLGSSTHAFELMLSAFILGLALGGLWIRRRIDSIGNSTRFIGLVQLVMGLLALSTLAIYGHTFALMQWTIKVLNTTEAAYGLFNVSSHLIALVVMLPTTFCAGMTLPLITYTLMRRGHGEKSIGTVYASNTVGAIAGVLIAVHVGLPVLGLKGLISLGAAIDISLALVLLWRARSSSALRVPVVSTAIGVAGVAATLLWVDLDAYKMASGVYRLGTILPSDAVEILYHKDGKTATVDLVAEKDIVHVRMNGKPEARISMSPNALGVSDEPTMILAGAIPLVMHSDARTVANIGMGSGLTTHSLLGVPWLERVDTIEIEPAMVEAAGGFGPRVEAVFTDPRSHIYIDDAKTYFSSRNKKYDIVVSEPSNPWVSGVASLFSEEFYRLITRHLSENGIFVQWLQLYEIDLRSVASVFKALSPYFSDYAVYAATNSDILIVAKHEGKLGKPDFTKLYDSDLETSLRRIGIRNNQDLQLRQIGNKRVLDPLFQSFAIAVNSDYFPVLDMNAARSRFLRAHALDLVGLAHGPVPAIEMLDATVATGQRNAVTSSPWFYRTAMTRGAVALREFLARGHFSDQGNDIPAALKRDGQLIRFFNTGCRFAKDWDVWLHSLFNVAFATIPYLTVDEWNEVWSALDLERCYKKLSESQARWISLLKAVSRRDAEQMAEIVPELLHSALLHRREYFDFALAAGMLANIVLDNPKETRQLWNTYGTAVAGTREPQLLFRLLVAHSRDNRVGSLHMVRRQDQQAAE